MLTHWTLGLVIEKKMMSVTIGTWCKILKREKNRGSGTVDCLKGWSCWAIYEELIYESSKLKIHSTGASETSYFCLLISMIWQWRLSVHSSICVLHPSVVFYPCLDWKCSWFMRCLYLQTKQPIGCMWQKLWDPWMTALGRRAPVTRGHFCSWSC